MKMPWYLLEPVHLTPQEPHRARRSTEPPLPSDAPIARPLEPRLVSHTRVAGAGAPIGRAACQATATVEAAGPIEFPGSIAYLGT